MAEVKPLMALFLMIGVVNSALGCTHVHLTSPDAPRFIMSPKYPSQYPDNVEECWVVDAKNIQPIHRESYRLLVLVEDFQLEQTSDCTDFVEIRDGEFANGTVLTKFCGSDSDRDPVFSSQDSVHVTFTSDMQGSGAGFQLRVMAVAVAPKGPKGHHYPECQALAIGSPDITYVLSTPAETEGKQCFIIYVSDEVPDKENQRIRFQFDNSMLNSFKANEHDYLEILDGDSPTGTQMAKLGQKQQVSDNTLYSTGNALYIHMKKSSSLVPSIKFQATFEVSDKISEPSNLRRRKRQTYSSSYRSSTYRSYTYRSSTYRSYTYRSYNYGYYYYGTYNTVSPAIVVGAVVGSVIFIAAIVIPLIICYAIKKKKRNTRVAQSRSPGTVHPPPRQQAPPAQPMQNFAPPPPQPKQNYPPPQPMQNYPPPQPMQNYPPPQHMQNFPPNQPMQNYPPPQHMQNYPPNQPMMNYPPPGPMAGDPAYPAPPAYPGPPAHPPPQQSNPSYPPPMGY